MRRIASHAVSAAINSTFGGAGNAFASKLNVFDGSKSRLLIFTPHRHIDQIVRPYRYNFTEAFVDEMLDSGSSDLLANISSASSAIREAIRPDQDGLEVDVHNYNDYWTFILFVDIEIPSVSNLQQAAPIERSIFTGYFLDEPCIESSLQLTSATLNEDARMVCTHADKVRVTTGYSGVGKRTNVRSQASVNLVHNHMGQNFEDQVGFCDIGHLARSSSYGSLGGSVERNANPLFLTELTNAMSIGTEYGSPRMHLMEIVDAFNTAKGINIGGTTRSALDAELGPSDDYDRAASVIESRLASSALPSKLKDHLDPDELLVLADLAESLPNFKVVPNITPDDYDLDIEDPQVLSPENIMSSMVANAVSAYAQSQSIDEIQFRYGSWTKSPDSRASRGAWKVSYATPIVDQNNDRKASKHQIESFKHLMEMGLFPYLEDYYGEFDLMVDYSGYDDTQVCLRYLDNDDENRGFITTHNRLGGLISPTLGGLDAVNGNFSNYKTMMKRGVEGIRRETAPDFDSDDLELFDTDREGLYEAFDELDDADDYDDINY